MFVKKVYAAALLLLSAMVPLIASADPYPTVDYERPALSNWAPVHTVGIGSQGAAAANIINQYLNSVSIQVEGLTCVAPGIQNFPSNICYFSVVNDGPAVLQQITWRWSLSINFFDGPFDERTGLALKQKSYSDSGYLVQAIYGGAPAGSMTATAPVSIVSGSGGALPPNIWGKAHVSYSVYPESTVPALNNTSVMRYYGISGDLTFSYPVPPTHTPITNYLPASAAP